MASSSGQQGLTTWTGVDGRSSQQGHHQPIKQPPSAPAKKDRTKKLGRQDAQIRNVEYLKAELEKIPGHVEFRNSLHHSQPNPGAVRSWMFAVNFTEAYNNAVLIVSFTLISCHNNADDTFCRMADMSRSRSVRSSLLSLLGMHGSVMQKGPCVSSVSMEKEAPTHLRTLLRRSGALMRRVLQSCSCGSGVGMRGTLVEVWFWTCLHFVYLYLYSCIWSF
jgi:hypothetical protein